jgi:hypothetical protein
MLFSTRFNLLKIVAQGVTNVTVAGSTTADTALVTHGLSYVPRARMWFEPVAGQIWPMSPTQFIKTGGGTGTVLTVFGNYFLTSSALFVRLENVSGSPVTIPVDWRVYADE